MEIKRHLRPTLQLFLPQVAIQVYAVANKNMIGIFDSITAVGYFNQSNSIILAITPFVTSLGTVMLPRVSNMFASGDTKSAKAALAKSFDVMSGLATPLMFGIMGISINFAPFFFGKDFQVVGLLMMIQAPIILFMAWSNVIGVQYLLPFNRLRPFTVSVTIGAILNVLLNFILIPLYGVHGSMFATLIAEMAVAIYQLYVVRQEFDVWSMLFNSWKYFLAGFLMFGVIYYLNTHWSMNITSLLLQVVIGAIIYVVLNVVMRTNLFIEGKKLLSRK